MNKKEKRRKKIGEMGKEGKMRERGKRFEIKESWGDPTWDFQLKRTLL